MEINICRPIIFYNNFVPPFVGKQEWEYEALGYYDGISVGKNIIQGKFELKQLWENLEYYAKCLEGKYTAQVMHIFRKETDELTVKDEIFWDGRTEQDKFPFLFIVMLRLNKSNGELDVLRKTLEQKGGEEVRIITYLSLDNNDLVVVIRSSKYYDGTCIVNQFHKEKSSGQSQVLYDSFSVAGINRKCLNSQQCFGEDKNRKIDKVCLRIIEKEPGSIQSLKEALFNQLGNEYPCYPVLGCEDEVIILEDIPYEKFWNLYKDETGILSSSNVDVYGKAVMGITSLLLQDMNNENGETEIFEKVTKVEKIIVKKMCETLREKYLTFYNVASEKQKGRERINFKTILQIVNSLQKYENMNYMDYTYMALYKPMNMLLALIDEARENKREDIFENISLFFHAVNLLTQNSLRLERQFIQSVELNARIYEAPVQISTFYAAYFALLRDILNEGARSVNHKYEFMICPGMMDSLCVQRLLPLASKKNRLLLVEIPENQMYDIQKMLIIMAHEAAHFVGRDVRQREKRYDYILQATVKSVSTLLVLDSNMHSFCSMESVKKYEEEFLKDLKDGMDVYFQNIERLSDGERAPEDRYHVEYLKDALVLGTQTMLLSRAELLDEIGANAFKESFTDGQEKELPFVISEGSKFKQKFEEAKLEFLIQMTIPEWTLADERCVKNIVDSNIHFFKEAFADLISILLLQITEEQYFNTLYNALLEENPIEGEYVFTGMWRVALIIKVMCEKSLGDDFAWRRGEFDKMLQSESDSVKKKVLRGILELIDNYLSGGKTIFDIYNEDKKLRESTRNLDRMYNRELGNIFCDYLEMCYVKFSENVREGIYGEKLCEIRNIFYELNHVDDVESYICCIREVIENYKKSFYELYEC